MGLRHGAPQQHWVMATVKRASWQSALTSGHCQMDAGCRTARSSSRTTAPRSSGCSTKIPGWGLRAVAVRTVSTMKSAMMLPQSTSALYLLEAHGKPLGCAAHRRGGGPRLLDMRTRLKVEQGGVTKMA